METLPSPAPLSPSPSSRERSALNIGTKLWLQILVTSIALAALIGLIIFFVTFKSNLCTTLGCIAAGERLSSSLNTSVDPCEDFAAYACGGWFSSHPIPDDQASMSTYQLTRELQNQAMRTVFEEENKKEPSSSKAKSVQLKLDLYRECTNMSARNRRGLEPVKRLFSELLSSSEWPAVDEPGGFVKSKLEIKTGGLVRTLARLLESYIRPLVNFYIDRDSNNSQSKIIFFTTPSFGLTRKEFANANRSFTAELDLYRRAVLEFGRLFYFSSSAHSMTFPDLAKEKALEARLHEVFTLERSLSLASRPAGEDRQASVWYNKMTLKELTSKTGNLIDYTGLMNELATLYRLPYGRFTGREQVIVRDVGYYRELSRILATTPHRTMYNYLGFKVAWYWADYTGRQVREFKFWYASQKMGVRGMAPLWKECLEEVNGWAASRLYIDHLMLPGTKERAKEMVNDLRKVFVEEVLKKESVGWMDMATRRRALEKAARMHAYVAYPDWILNNTDLDRIKYHFTETDYVRVKRGHYFEGMLEASRWDAAISLRELHLSPDVERDFLLWPITVNAMAALGHNAVAITAGELQPPFFDPTVPEFLNYGLVGSVIGHEITHLFDDMGAQHDGDGNLVNWWSEETGVRFREKAQCFVKQYEAIVDQTTGVRLNGTRSLGENIADCGGPRQSLLALEARLRKDERAKMQKLPQMEQFTPQQLFFLSYAHMWCEHFRVKTRKMIVEHFAHLPGEYRINVPLSNLEQFSAAFNCPLGSKMNPVKKCRLW